MVALAGRRLRLGRLAGTDEVIGDEDKGECERHPQRNDHVDDKAPLQPEQDQRQRQRRNAAQPQRELGVRLRRLADWWKDLHRGSPHSEWLALRRAARARARLTRVWAFRLALVIGL